MKHSNAKGMEMALDATIDAREMTKDKHGCSGRTIPAEWERLELSLRCGKKVNVFHVGDTVMLIRANGREAWDSIDSWLKNGKYTTPVRGSTKVIGVITELGKLLADVGLANAIKQYTAAHCVCCCCGAYLTDDESKLRGIGPVCVQKIHGMALMRVLFAG